MKDFHQFLLLLLSIALFLPLPSLIHAAPTAAEIIAIAQQQLAAPTEFAQGEMRIYQHTRLARTYDFVLGRLWDAATRTENVRVDFHSPVALELGDSSRHADNRYLLRRTTQAPPTQWLYLPALRRVRLTPYRPTERVLTSHYFFYDLTWALALGDFRYQFAATSPNDHTPILEGEPLTAMAPYHRIRVTLERHEQTYLITAMTVVSPDATERTLHFADFREVSPGYYRPRTAVWISADGRTELTFPHWVVRPASPLLFSPAQLETQTLVVPE
ncbi:MAG: outer membrane lipoprotein-sorting protein [Deltaproteobacteria bacterium]|nr:outer membrane lipoprotein-sorting protein [Deltaproteobacteria bacterium]